MWVRKLILISLTLVFLLLTSGVLQAGINMHQPGKIIVNTIEKGLVILTNPSYNDTEKKQKLWEHLEPIFDFKIMSKRALGQYWKNRTDKEREKFTTVFSSVLKHIYLDKTASYSGEEVVYVREFVQDGRAKVQTNVITSEGKKISVDFSMHKINGNWKNYDVIIEGVSIVNNYRSQFDNILSKSSFKELMEKLREKEEKFN